MLSVTSHSALGKSCSSCELHRGSARAGAALASAVNVSPNICQKTKAWSSSQQHSTTLPSKGPAVRPSPGDDPRAFLASIGCNPAQKAAAVPQLGIEPRPPGNNDSRLPTGCSVPRLWELLDTSLPISGAAQLNAALRNPHLGPPVPASTRRSFCAAQSAARNCACGHVSAVLVRPC